MIRVDHVLNYKPPKDTDEIDDITKFLREEGCAASTLDDKKEQVKQMMDKKQADEKQIRSNEEYLKSKYGDVQNPRYGRGNDKYDNRDKSDFKRTEHKQSSKREYKSNKQYDDRDNYR